MQARRLIPCLLLVALATATVAQTEYEAAREPAMQRLGAQLQRGELATARGDLAGYLDEYPGDAVMQYNLACLAAMAGDTTEALARLATAFDAGYRDLDRPLEDPDLFALRDDPRLTALLDATRADLVAAMLAAEVFLEESLWSEPLVLAPVPGNGGDAVSPGTLRVRHDPIGLTLEITPPPAGADEVVVCVSLPRNLDEHETRRWFEFHAPLGAEAAVARTGRHGRPDPASDAGRLTAAGGIWALELPWSSLHPYRPPVELLLGLDVTLRRATGTVPADRWSLVRDPNAGSAIISWRRFAPLFLDPGPTPARLVAGRLDTYLVVGDSLSVELGVQGLAGGNVRLDQTVDGRPDTSFTTALEPDLAYRTLDYRLPAEPPTGWFELGATIIEAAGDELRWSDRGFRLQPNWFVMQNERLAGVPQTERPVVQYELLHTLRGQQQFQPHDDPTAIATAALRAGELLDRYDATGTILPTDAGVFAAAFPLGKDALQACRLVLSEADRRGEGPLVVVVTMAQVGEEALAMALAAGRQAGDRRTFLVLPMRVVPGRVDLAAAAVSEAAAWAEALLSTTGRRYLVTPGLEAAARLAAAANGDSSAAVLTLSGEAAAWAAAILAGD